MALPRRVVLLHPDGLPIVDLNFNEETFRCATTDNDIRFGCLAFGVIQEEPPS